MKKIHEAIAHSTRMVIMLIGHGNPESDGPAFQVEMREVDDVKPADFVPPVGTRAYAFYWDHEVRVTADRNSCKGWCMQPIGRLYTTNVGWPKRDTLRDNSTAPGLLGEDPQPYSFLFAELLGRNVYIREMPTR